MAKLFWLDRKLNIKEILLDRIILGHNQFFGVSHMSSERGAERKQFFSNIDNVIDIIRFAHSQGATGLMLSTHPRAKEIAEALLKEPTLANNLQIYLLLPYMAKYVTMANEKGMINAVFDTLKQANWSERTSISIRGGIGVFTRNYHKILGSLIDIELLPFKGLNIKAVFLHNSLTDLAIGLNLLAIIKFFNEYILEKHRITPAFCTLSSGLVMQYLNENNIENPVIMAPFNPAGFQMSPSKEICEKVLHEVPANVIAMSALAAGYVKPADASVYLATLPQIKSVVVGASSRKHIIETFKLFK